MPTPLHNIFNAPRPQTLRSKVRAVLAGDRSQAYTTYEVMNSLGYSLPDTKDMRASTWGEFFLAVAVTTAALALTAETWADLCRQVQSALDRLVERGDARKIFFRGQWRYYYSEDGGEQPLQLAWQVRRALPPARK